ncbi:MAG: hypothetical protein QNJ91_05625 [Gammaproteobacteria bacterium]|nr:hypothetical protein [Gammaproteobacteria bacterium]
MPTQWSWFPLPDVTPLTPLSVLGEAAVDRRRHAPFDPCPGARGANRADPTR